MEKKLLNIENQENQENNEKRKKIYEKPTEELILLTGKRKEKGPLEKLSEDMPQVEPEEPEEEKDQEDKEKEEQENNLGEDNPWQLPIKKPYQPIDRETIENFIKFQEEKRQKEEEESEKEKSNKRLTPKERKEKARKEEDERVIRKNFKSEEDIEKMLKVAEEYNRIEESIRPYIDDLAKVFEQIMQSISKQITLGWERGFKSGRFDINRFIEKYAGYLQEGAPPLSFDQLDVYDQKEFIERLSLFPEKIRVRLVLDGSGSMTLDRIIALKQIAVLIMEALSLFEFVINFRFKLKRPIRVDTEIRMFGSFGNSPVIKSFAEDKNYNPEQEKINRLEAFQYIDSSYGGTCDAEPWWKINDSLNKNPDYLEDLKKGRAKEFVFEITDGGSNESTKSGVSAEQDTRDAIAAVEKKGVIALGFQIGEPDDSEKKIFDKIWGEKGSRIDHPEKLAPVIAKTLANEIKKIQFQIQYEERVEE